MELPVEDVTVKSGEENGHEENAPSEVTEASTAAVSYTHLDVYKRQVVLYPSGNPMTVQMLSAGKCSCARAT